MANIYEKTLYEILSRWGYQEGDDAEFNCWRMYFGEHELDMGEEMDINSVLAYPDGEGVVVTWDEGGGSAYLCEFDEKFQRKLLDEVADAIIAFEDNFLTYLASLNITAEQVLRGAIRDREKPMGYLLSYLRDMTGFGKRALWHTAENILKELGIELNGFCQGVPYELTIE